MSDVLTARRRPVYVPASLDDLRGPRDGDVELPLHLWWSGPKGRRWDLADERQLQRLYEVVLTEGSPGDPETWLDAEILRRVWPSLYLPPHLRQAWEPLLTC